MDAPGASSPALDTTGTSGDDLYKGVIGATTTLQNTDDLDGKGGQDELSVLVTTATTVVDDANVDTNPTTYTPLFLTDIEKVTVRDTTAAVDATGVNAGTFDTSLVTVDLANAEGVTEVVNDRSAETVTFQNIGTAAVTTQNISTAGVGTTFTRGSSSVSDALTINLSALGAAAAPGSAAVQAGDVASNDGNNDATEVTINTSGFVSVSGVNVTGTAAAAATHTAETVNINAAGTTVIGANALTGFDTTKAGTINVNGEGSVSLGNLVAAVQTVNASGNTGGVSLSGTQYTATNAAAVASPGLQLTGGEGNDTFAFNGVESAVVSMGAGDDTARVNADTLAAGASIDGGEGTDRVAMSTADIVASAAQTTAGANLRAAVTGFEELAVSNALSADFNINNAGGYNYLEVEGQVDNGGAVNVSGFTTGATVEFNALNVQTSALNVGMADAALNPDDVLNLKLNANLAGNTGSEATYKAGITGINTVNVDANDAVDNVVDNNAAVATRDNGADDGYTLALSSAANLNTLNITGTSLVNYTLAGGTDAVKLIDASESTGNLTLSVANFAGTERVEIKGSQGVNNITGSDLAFGEKITGGAKNDIIDAGAGADDITGNGGRDVFVIADADSSVTGSVDQITDFGQVTTAASAAEVGAMNSNAAFQASATGKGGLDADLIDFGTAATLGGAAAAASVVATLEGMEAGDQYAGKEITVTEGADGLLTLGGADQSMVDSLDKWVAVADQAAGTPGDVVVFEFDSNTYVFQQGADDTGTVGNDNVVELTDVTGVTGISLAGGVAGAEVGDIFIA